MHEKQCTRGHLTFYYKDQKVMFTGDHFSKEEQGDELELDLNFCWYDGEL